MTSMTLLRRPAVSLRLLAGGLALATLGACAAPPDAMRAASPAVRISPELARMYGPVQDGERLIPAVPPQYLSERNRRQVVDYWTTEKPGTIVVDSPAKFLYLVLGDDRAIRYGIAVGEEGRGFSGVGTIPVKREWPSWTPTQNMIRENPELYGPVSDGLEGGLDNPLGARALYLYRGGRDTYFRIHGTNAPWSIGDATSAGCIRLYNQDILDLYERVDRGTRVVVLSPAQSGRGTYPPAGAVSAVPAPSGYAGPT